MQTNEQVISKLQRFYRSERFHGNITLMISIIQRVTTATVTVNNQEIGKIDTGIMALIAVEKEDTPKDVDRLLERILNYPYPAFSE